MKIFLFTNQFPYGKGEEFLREELRCKGEEDDICICSMDINEENKYLKQNIANEIIIENIKEIRLTSKLLISCFKNILHCKPLYEEFKWLISRKNVHFLTLRRMVVAWIRANIIKEKILQVVNRRRKEDEKVILYSYWASHTAISLALIQEKGLKRLTRLHRIDLYEELHEYNYLPFRNYMYKNLDFLYPISAQGKIYIQNNYKSLLLEDKCFVSRLATKDYGTNPDDRIDGEIVIVSCSNVVEVKRVHLILEVLKNLDIKVKWIHFGDGLLLKDVREEANKLDNSYLTCIFMGYKDKEYIMKYYKSHHIDLFINVSYSEGIPVSIMEAISFGIPVIATSVGGVNEIIEDGKNGWLIHRDKVVDELNKNIIEFCNMKKKEKIDMRLNARKKWRISYSAEINYVKFYESIRENI